MNFNKIIQTLLVEYDRQMPKDGEREIYVALVPSNLKKIDMSVYKLTPDQYNGKRWQDWLDTEKLYPSNEYFHNNFKDAQQDLLSKLTTHTTYNYNTSQDKQMLAQRLQEIFEPYMNLICKNWFIIFKSDFPRGVYLGIEVDVDKYKASTHAQQELYGF